MSAAPTATSVSCPRCGSRLAYEGRPCNVCLSPAVFAVRDGKLEGITGFERASTVALPEFAKPKLVRGKKIRKPRRERAVAMARTVSKWTWHSVAIALCVHVVALAAAMYFQEEIHEVVRHVQKVDIKEQAALAPTPQPAEEQLDAPELENDDDEMVIPDQILDNPDILAGDPEYDLPPEETPFAPQDQVAPIQPSRPRPDSLFRPDSSQGLGGGRPDSGITRPQGSGLFKNRAGMARSAALKRHGGGQDTEDAVNLALKYLADNQKHNGSWDPNDGFQRRPSWATLDNGYRGAITALCTLPFLAAGHSPDHGKYKKEVRRAVEWLMENQTSDGGISYKGVSEMYTHTVAALALCEAYGLSKDEEIGNAAERAVRYLERTQGARGGWDYNAAVTATDRSFERNDLSISGWAVLALKSAKAVGIKVNKHTMDALSDLYDRHSLKSGETYYADRSHGQLDPHRKGIGMVGVGLTSRVILDRGRFEVRNFAAEQLLLENVPTWEKFREPSYGANDPNFNTFYGVYYGTLGMFLLNNGQGPAWEKWNKSLKSMLLENQVMSGSRKGSWPAADSWIGPIMGDFYSTALGALSLEVYYRYNPMHRPQEDNPEPVVRTPREAREAAERRTGTEEEEMGRPVVIDGQTLDLDQPGQRSKYLRLLAKAEGRGATHKLMEHLEDESLSVRSTALYELAKLESQDAASKVQKMLKDPENDPIQLTIVYALGELGDRSVYKSLTPMLRSGDTSLKNAASSALVSLSGGKDFGINRRAWENWFRNNQ